MSNPTTRRRVVASALAAVTLTTGLIVTSASPAAAQPDPGHVCGNPLVVTWDDDSPLLDPVHHAVEPLVPGSHQLVGCQVQAVFNTVSCYLPGLAGLLAGSRSPGSTCP